MKGPRQIAAEALIKMEHDAGYSNLILDAALERSALTGSDRALCTALFYGVLERQLTLDHVLRRHSKTPVEKLSPAVRALLRMALYELIYQGTRPHAAVNEAVTLSRRLGASHASGYINGVLRAFLRAGGTVEYPDRSMCAGTAYLSVRYSVPRALVEQWQRDYPQLELEALLAALEARTPVYLRTNSLKTTDTELIEWLGRDGIEAVPTQLPGCLQTSRTGGLEQSAAFREGFFTVQDLASQLCCAAVEVAPGMRVADMCAAPGGKSFTLAQLLENTGEVLALDSHAFKTELIMRSARRLGLANVRSGVNDAQAYNPQLGRFDRVLCDVPCSGLGVIAKKPEIRTKDLAALAGLPEKQYKILKTSSQYTEVGGRLIYSTCTLSRAENEAVAERFLSENPQFEAAALPPQVLQLAKAPEGAHMATLFPHLTQSDGFFIAAFVRRRGTP